MARKTGNVTTDHETIRRWGEERNAKPACVRGTGGGQDTGMIRLDFPGYSGDESLEHISWDDWFQKFDESNLALLYQEKTARGQKSNFNKLIARETAEAREEGYYRASRRRLKSGTARKATHGSSTRRRAAASKSSRSSRSASARSSSRTASRRSTAKRSSSSRSSTARARRNRTTDRSERSARTKRASSSRTRSSGASSRARTPGKTTSRSKSRTGATQRARGDVTRRSGTTVGRNRGKAPRGKRQYAARSTGRRSAKRQPEKVIKMTRRGEPSGRSKRPSRVTKQVSGRNTRSMSRTHRKAA